ncbi:N-acetylglucosamine-6-phosphate deacetylase [Bacillus spongiae]|uniref:N-acetylglucosamine-6-phosphate deacetylase n=1 Tax=Bacillus spongiae TaxID=2683610 RepID=A0ABU8HGC7_9BACI
MNIFPDKLAIENVKIYGESSIFDSGFIKIDKGMIREIGSMDELTSMDGYYKLPVPNGMCIVPGMIDLHIHGVNSADAMDSTFESLDRMTMALPKEGTTSFLATTMTERIPIIEQALGNIGDYINQGQRVGRAELIGVHLEGPFINKEKAGAQPIEYILMPDVNLFKRWLEYSKNTIKVVTLAPEVDKDFQLVHYLSKNGIVASAGHSNVSFERAYEAIDEGINHITHLFNQMSGFHHRDPGLVGAAFTRKEVMVELIADGIHVRPEVVDIAFRQVTEERMILITDSMRAKGMKNGDYDLGGQQITVKDGKALLDENTLAGSVLKMIDAFKNIQRFAQCDIVQAIKMTSENPAKQLNLFHRKGSVAPGKDADLVLLDQELNVYMTICRGKVAFNRSDE